MRKVFFTICFMLMTAIASNAQTFAVSQLKNAKWERVYPQLIGEDEVINFTNTQFITKLMYPALDKTITQTYPYYLSETKTLTFDNSQVGKNTKGKYLVVWVEQYQQTYCFNIISMSDDFFKISICEGEMAVYKKKK